jgi:hypothetical protein
MRLTVIPEDKTIIKDGKAIAGFEGLPAEIHAIQWHDTKGTVEYKDGSALPVDFEFVQSYSSLFDVEEEKQNSRPEIESWEVAEYVDGEWVVRWAVGVTLESIKDIKQASLTAYVKQFLSSAMADYSEWESVSWTTLANEAAQFQADGTIGEYMAAEIGVKYPDAESLALVILARKDAMKSLRAGVVLVRQTKEAAIENAETIEELNDVQIESGWPGQE